MSNLKTSLLVAQQVPEYVSDQNGKKFQKFTGIAFSNCTDCHKDIHENKFGKDCKKCHNEESFKKINTTGAFDHSKTDYPLEGKHVKVECKSCHKQSLTAKIKFSLCTDCHKDYHKGQLNKPGASSDCKDCHTIEGFKPSQYTVERHNKSEFQLGGSHLATPCFACHKKGEEWVFKDLKKSCVDCHENIHKNYIDDKFFGKQNCENCHSVSVWGSVKFDHNTTDFKLTGKHAEANCKQCHFKKDANGLVKQQFSSLTNRCLDCHTDVHNNQFDISASNSCTRCHGYDRWKPVQFNHDKARFKLDGSHKNVACVKCHKVISKGTQRYVQYKFDNIKCVSCHLR
jgi:nitrate/TMAO reductase-like tetraheme cytochrome c subunit